jgi:Tfp pilus assembly protein PilV
MQFNSDTGSNYAWHWMDGNGSSATAQNGTSTASPWTIESAGNSATASAYGAFVVDVLDYASISKNKTVRSLSGYDGNGNGVIALASNLWLNTSAVNSIKLSPIYGSSINEYSQFSVYGVKG